MWNFYVYLLLIRVIVFIGFTVMDTIDSVRFGGFLYYTQEILRDTGFVVIDMLTTDITAYGTL